MSGTEPESSAAALLGLWRSEEGYSAETFLALSGGDMWTGPAISTWFEGESMVEVMNGMGYDAAAVGNHEFDFGLDALRERVTESAFPLLSANVRYRSDNTTPLELGIRPFTVVTINGIEIGIIGLTTTSTPYTTHPKNVADFDFIDYESALRQTVPQAMAAGAELILVPAHVCKDELEQLAQRIGDLGVHMLGAGHCNELFAEEMNGIVLIGGGFHMTSYARVDFHFDVVSKKLIETSSGVSRNTDGEADPMLQSVVAEWQAEVESELELVIGHTGLGIQRGSQKMQALITESWLWSYPSAHVAITNMGGMRAALPAGDITLSGIVGVMPFDNVIIELTLTGEQLLAVLSTSLGDAAVGGIHREGRSWIFNRTGDAVDPGASYGLLVNDFMYAGGDEYGILAEFDPDAYDTSINWRQPVIDWIEAQGSTPEKPIDDAVSQIGRS
jgi:2',3'-cyclic-nucleotide 2'-phosphodiesterase (5'-nucleotidase family)